MTAVRPLRGLFASTAMSLVLASCGLLEQVQRIGVSAGQDGSGILVHHVPCPGEVLSRITLAVGDPEEGGTVVWEIAGAGAGGPYEVGTTPPGMSETVPPGSIPTAGELHLEVATQEGGVTRTSSLSFDAASLTSDRIVTFGGAKDPETFRRDALETCEA